MNLLKSANHFIHDHLLKLLLAMYGLAILFPSFGIGIKNLSIGNLRWGTSTGIHLSLPFLMLSYLLFNAGLSVHFRDFKKVFLVPLPLGIGLLSNILVPLVFTAVVAGLGKVFWHNPDEVQNVLVGLAIIASMPIAGSATAWVQNGNGNAALILGLVVFSTVLSPIFSPLVFHAIGYLTRGDYSEDLHELANQGASSFLIVSVAMPALIGMTIRLFLSDSTWAKIAPNLKTVALVDLLILNYSNASMSLPIAFKNWDPDFFAMIIGVTCLLCIVTFSLGWLIPKVLKVPTSERISLTYGLGMTNNGTGLVLASTTLADHPFVMLPIIFYNLGQQIVAGILNSKLSRKLGKNIKK